MKMGMVCCVVVGGRCGRCEGVGGVEGVGVEGDGGSVMVWKVWEGVEGDGGSEGVVWVGGESVMGE